MHAPIPQKCRFSHFVYPLTKEKSQEREGAMQKVGLIVVFVVSIGCTVAIAADEVTERAVPSSPALQQVPTVPGGQVPTLTVEQKIAALQQQVQALQAQLAAVQSVLKVTPTGATLQAPTLSLLSIDGTTIQSSKGIAITAGVGIAMHSQAGTSIKAGSSASVEAADTMDVKGATIKLNGGGKPLATVGSAVGGGKILTGSSTLLGN
jgi:hypothetical protein